MRVLYCHGLGSSIDNRMGLALLQYFSNKPQFQFERLIYSNPGSKNKLWNVTEWKNDIEDKIKSDEWILMATSAGGHAALNAAFNRPHNIMGLFLFCPGTHCTMSYVERLAPNAIELLRNGKELIHPASRNGHEALVNLQSFQTFLDTCISKKEGSIDISCPVHIIHGTDDDTIPYQSSLKLAERLTSADVQITIIKGATHYLEFDETVKHNLDAFLRKFDNKKSHL